MLVYKFFYEKLLFLDMNVLKVVTVGLSDHYLLVFKLRLEMEADGRVGHIHMYGEAKEVKGCLIGHTQMIKWKNGEIYEGDISVVYMKNESISRR